VGGTVQAYEIGALLEQRARSGRLYLEFLRHPAMSLGVYSLKAGGVDPQNPHREDEVYYILAGRGQIRVGGEDRSVQAGSIVFVALGVPHRFHSITEDMDVLVFFAPAEA
jgi:mannose-6-phosphate isomerase-like protein (cupin superfamily)